MSSLARASEILWMGVNVVILTALFVLSLDLLSFYFLGA